MNEQIKQLKESIQRLQSELKEAEKSLSLPENNVFNTLEEAEDVLYFKLEDKAVADCEGSYNCGKPQYTQLFYVDKTLYKAIANVEYNRHDKTYYYVDEFDFKIEKVGA